VRLALLSCEGVGAAAVLLAHDTLVAFVVPDASNDFDSRGRASRASSDFDSLGRASRASLDRDAHMQRLRDSLAERLPSAMTPSRIVFLEKLPLTPSGKVDRAALRESREPDRVAL